MKMAALSLFCALLSVLAGAACAMTTLGNQEVLEGQSLTIPCHYNPQYKHNVKYWCQGSMKDFCTTLARTDNPSTGPNSMGKVIIADDPSQNVFTVMMRGLKQEDSAWYWCGVEVGSMWTADITASLYITVIHDMTVVNRTLIGQEGGSVSLKSIYSIKLRETEKTLCRSGDMTSCCVTDASGIFNSRSILIKDDRMSTVMVTFKKLEMRDAGWYNFAAGQIQQSVQVVVMPRPSTTILTLKTKAAGLPDHHSSVVNAQDSSGYQSWVTPLIVCGVMTLLCLVFFGFWSYWKQRQIQLVPQRLEEQTALTVCSKTDGDWKNPPVILLNTSGQNVGLY